MFFHNLKFDGQSIISYFVDKGCQYGVDYTAMISSDGVWYQITIQSKGHTIKIWDSLKKFPGLSVSRLAKTYGYSDKKEKPHFGAYRPIDYQPTEEEIEYCLQDSRIVAYAIGKQWENGYKGMTLSSDAFHGVKASINQDKGYTTWRKEMPALTPEWDAWIRKSYKGGWTYLNPVYANKTLEDIKVYDVNSLYPWVMHDCPLPVGHPKQRKPKGNELYVIKFRCTFQLNEGYLPMVQIKGQPYWYKGTEYLECSLKPETLTMTSVDFDIFTRHYDVEILSEPQYVSFQSKVGLLADYIDC